MFLDFLVLLILIPLSNPNYLFSRLFSVCFCLFDGGISRLSDPLLRDPSCLASGSREIGFEGRFLEPFDDLWQFCVRSMQFAARKEFRLFWIRYERIRVRKVGCLVDVKVSF